MGRSKDRVKVVFHIVAYDGGARGFYRLLSLRSLLRSMYYNAWVQAWKCRRPPHSQL